MLNRALKLHGSHPHLHSKLLIHWTGRKQANPARRAINPRLREKYVDLLEEICQKGLYMNPGEETIHGVNDAWIKAKISRICFTEVRLSQAERHARQYGSLGIGFSREFVMEREGNPVFYVQSGGKGHVAEHLASVESYLKKANKEEWEALQTVLGYLKNMSQRNSTDLQYYEEMEWRVVHLERLEREGYIIPDDKQRGLFRLTFEPDDVKILIFPDRKTQKSALKNPTIARFFNKDFPMVATLDECKNF